MVNKVFLTQLKEMAGLCRSHFARRRRIYSFVFFLVFAIGLVFSIRNLDLKITHIGLALIGFDLVVGAPLAILTTSLNLKASAKIIGCHISLSSAYSATAAGVVAEVAPAPGGLIARGAALLTSGASLLQAGHALFVSSILGLGVAFLAAGAALLGRSIALASLLIFIGAGSLFACVIWARRRSSFAAAMAFLFTKVASWIVLTARIALALAALGVATDFSNIALFAFSGMFGGAVPIVPGGLGVREGLAAAFAAANDFSPSVAFMAMAINRFVGLAFCGVWIANLGFRGVRRANN